MICEEYWGTYLWVMEFCLERDLDRPQRNCLKALLFFVRFVCLYTLVAIQWF